MLLGYSQTSVLPIAQLASLFGVYGVSALVVSVNAALTYVVLARSRTAMRRAAFVGVCVAGVAIWGSIRLSRSALTSQGPTMRIAGVQGNVRQEHKWDPAQAATILNSYLTMTRAAAQQGARFVMWPESSIPFYFDEDPVDADRVRALVRDTGVTLLFGSDEIERGTLSAFHAGRDESDRAGSLPRALRQHRHQRHRRSIRPHRDAVRTLRAGGLGRRGAVPQRHDAVRQGR